MREVKELFIDGAWTPSTGSARIEVVSPSSEEAIGFAPDGTAADMDRAVAAARRAFDHGPWPRMSVKERADILRKVAAYLRERAGDITNLLCDEVGSPISFLRAGAGGVPTMIDLYADIGEAWSFETPRAGMVGPALIRQEPVGVVAAISPWNGPLFLMMIKTAPALVAGCTVVAKPAPETPLDAFYVAEAALAAGLPPGVLNIVPAGREVGEHLVRHPGIDKVAFTGSTAAGRRIGAICGEQLKRCSLELGGKSAAVVLDDATVESVVKCAIPLGLAFNNGQACAALTRIVVPRRRLDEFTDAITAAVETLKVGDPHEDATAVGPLIAERQRIRVEGYIQKGVQEGARLTTGGKRPPNLTKGWYVAPTVFTDVRNDMTIAQEEIFGPVGVIIPYDGGDEEAVAIANQSEYGLGGAVFSADPDRGYEAAKRVRTGTIGVNTFYVDLKCPFGGFKASGIGREMGVEGLQHYLETKSLYGRAA
ncbi:MAG: aldehyde dehydrogenase [Hyphomonadaceae bacterium]